MSRPVGRTRVRFSGWRSVAPQNRSTAASDLDQSSPPLIRESGTVEPAANRPPTRADLSGLPASVGAEVLLPGTRAYESARRPALAQFFDRHPAATVLCLSTDDTARTVAYARQVGAPEASDELSVNLQLSVPGEIADPPTASLVSAMCADQATTAAQLTGLAARVGTEPTSTAWPQLPYALAKRALDEGPVDGSEPAGLTHRKTEFFPAGLPGGAVAGLLGILTSDRMAGQAREISFLPMGGAYNRIPATATAFAHRDQRFLIEHLATVGREAPDREQQAAWSWVSASWSAVHPWASGRVYPNFPDLGLTNWAHAYWGENHQRLREVKHRYDPNDVFHVAQSL